MTTIGSKSRVSKETEISSIVAYIIYIIYTYIYVYILYCWLWVKTLYRCGGCPSARLISDIVFFGDNVGFHRARPLVKGSSPAVLFQSSNALISEMSSSNSWNVRSDVSRSWGMLSEERRSSREVTRENCMNTRAHETPRTTRERIRNGGQ